MDTLTDTDLAKFQLPGSAQILPVILSGGAGTRLWPLSRSSYPKQLLKLASERTLLQDTALRTLSDVGFAAPVLVCNEDHRFLVGEQLREIGVTPQTILLEPLPRNTAPAIAAAALWALTREPDVLLLIQPSDHVIADGAAFHRAVMSGVTAAQAGRLVTFGIKPRRADTGYGYIQSGAPIPGTDGCLAITRFVEKPDLATAGKLVAGGDFLWNSGIFLVSARTYLRELGRVAPDMLAACTRAVQEGEADQSFFRLGAAAFGEAPSLSIDRTVMERTERGAVVPVDMAWSDVGSWAALREIAKADEQGNVLMGDVVTEGVRNSYIRSGGQLVAAIGLENVVVVTTPDAVLVAHADQATRISGIVETLRRQKRTELDHNLTDYRPWGRYSTVDAGDRFQVKRITVDPGAALSLQLHYHRAEHWIIVQGTAIVQRGQDRLIVRENECTYIPMGTEHRLENPGKVPLVMIEVQSGAYLGEDDIVRLSDNYGRA